MASLRVLIIDPNLAVVLLITFSCVSNCLSLPSLTPPAGNSLSRKVRTQNGLQMYRCDAQSGNWIMDAASATLVDIATGAVVGNFSSTLQLKNIAGTWTLLNDDGDHAESGDAYSSVTGKPITQVRSKQNTDLNDWLAVATNHTNEGVMSMVSYISMVGTKGGQLGQISSCSKALDGKANLVTTSVPFEAEFHFWTQDLLPPMQSIPNPLLVNTQRPIQAFYASGVVVYLYNGTQWLQKQVFGDLYDVPGGTQVGSFFTKPSLNEGIGNLCWHINNPNGFEIEGKLACQPQQVSPDCLPWSLNLVTTNSGNLTVFGPYTYIQMISTMGGLPPKRLIKPLMKNQLWKSSFSAIYWFYSRM